MALLSVEEKVLMLTQDRCTFCVKHTIGSKSFWPHPMGLLGNMGHVESYFFPFEYSVSFGQDRCMVCTRHTIGSEIILDTLDGITR
jgi:hypothetical protein